MAPGGVNSRKPIMRPGALPRKSLTTLIQELKAGV